MRIFAYLLFVILSVTVTACSGGTTQTPNAATSGPAYSGKVKLYLAASKGYVMSDKIVKTPEEWRKQLTPGQYHVTREQGTERAFTGSTWNNHDKGVYQCIC